MKWRVGLYGRVSTEHEEQQESIKVQRESLIQYAVDNGFEIAGSYFDEGYSGTNFERPGMASLKNDIDCKKMNAVIVKDLSRIGRNNSLTLLFLDYLVRNNVRLIAINDNYDTLKDDDDMIGIKTWVNERYSRELSQKIKFALKHKKRNGEYLAAFAPYGYKKSDKVKNKLEIDCFAASVVKYIFDLYINGYGFLKIAKLLDKKGVPNPSRYGVYGRKSDRWDWTTIKRIITNPVYMGHSVQQRYYRRSFKDRSMGISPISEWIVVSNTHEAVIGEDIFNMAQQIMDKRRNKVKYRCGTLKPHLFTSFLYCHECGYPMYFKKDKYNNGCYRCGQYIKYGRNFCTSHFISEQELVEIVQNQLIFIIDKYIDCEKMTDEVLEKERLDDKSARRIKHIEGQILKTKNKIETLYVDKLNGIIGEEVFLKLGKEMRMVLSALEEEYKSITDGMAHDIDNRGRENDLRSFIRSIVNMNGGLDREILERFIARIEVCENGDVIITFNFLEP